MTQEYYEKRKEELAQSLASEWLKRGQAAKEVEDCDKQIGRIKHRMDEIDRALMAMKQQQAATGNKKEDEPPVEPPKE